MIGNILRHILIFLGLFIFQLIFIDQLNSVSLLNPFVVILSIILLPINISRIWILLIAFAEGYLLDVFQKSGGIQSFSFVLIAFIRPYILMLFIDKESIAKEVDANSNLIGLRRFILYSFLLVFTYHIVSSFLQISSFRFFSRTLLSAVLSSVASMVLVTIFSLLFNRKVKSLE